MSEPVLLVIDIGNTNVSLGIFDYAKGEAKLAQHWRLSTHREQTSDELSVSLLALFRHEFRQCFTECGYNQGRYFRTKL